MIVFNYLNARATQIVDRGDLAAHVDTDPLPASQEITLMSDYDLPQMINLKFQEPARNYSVNAIYAARYNTPSRLVEDMDVTVALDRDTAYTCLYNLLSNRMLARRSYKMMLPRKYITLEPTDAFKMPNLVDPIDLRPVLLHGIAYRREWRAGGPCGRPPLGVAGPGPDRSDRR